MIEPASNLLGLIREVCAMGLYFPVYPPEDLGKLDQQSRIKLKTAIINVLHNDADVKALIKAKTKDTFDSLKKP
jgi:hypothetical protein